MLYNIISPVDTLSSRSVLYTMSNNSIPSPMGQSTCSNFVSLLCLDGDYVVYVVSPEAGDLDVTSSSGMNSCVCHVPRKFVLSTEFYLMQVSQSVGKRYFLVRR